MIIEIVLGLFVLAEGYVIWNLMVKQEKLEDWTESYIEKIGVERTVNKCYANLVQLCTY